MTHFENHTIKVSNKYCILHRLLVCVLKHAEKYPVFTPFKKNLTWKVKAKNWPNKSLAWLQILQFICSSTERQVRLCRIPLPHWKQNVLGITVVFLNLMYLT